MPSGKEKRKMALQADKTRQSPLCSFLKTSRKVFLWILKKREGRYRKASLTVEAAVAVPVFLLAVGSILGILDIYRMQSLIKTSLHQSAMELGMYAYGENGDSSIGSGISSAFCMAYARSRMPDFGEHVKFSYVGTAFRNNELILRAQAEYKLPVSLTFVPPIRFTNEAKVNCWVGWDKTKDIGEGMPNGKKWYIYQKMKVFIIRHRPVLILNYRYIKNLRRIWMVKEMHMEKNTTVVKNVAVMGKQGLFIIQRREIAIIRQNIAVV